MFFKKWTFKGKSQKYLQSIKTILNQINKLGNKYQYLSDNELKNMIEEKKKLIRENKIDLDDILVEVFTNIREVTARIIGKRLFDEQILGGIIVHKGKIAELKTGEGKTLMSALPIILGSLTGKGVHVITVNDYLASRDHDILKPLYQFYSISSGYITNETDTNEKYDIYKKDVVYCTCSRLAFDYLESNMETTFDKKFRFSKERIIIDEADNIMIDESKIPLVISASADKSNKSYELLVPIFKKLEDKKHYTIDTKTQSAYFTKDGYDIIEDFTIKTLGLPKDQGLFSHHVDYYHILSNLLKAHTIMIKNKHYTVYDNEVIIIDASTGRLAKGKKYHNGLHQAIEAKEGLKISNQTTVQASITYPNFLNGYKVIGGMTGTGIADAHEFSDLYYMDVVEVPTHNPKQRIDNEARLYKTKQIMNNAITKMVIEKHTKGQPILIGTGSVLESEELSQHFKDANISHNILNAKNHKEEAHIIAQAGRLGAVTISTNMAGRGVDIQLGGNPQMHSEKVSESESESADAISAKMNKIVEKERIKVKELGGLCVIMAGILQTEKDEQQLAGRSGRQGDPGESWKFSALDEEKIQNATAGASQSLSDITFADDNPQQYLKGFHINAFIQDIQKGQQTQNYEMTKHMVKFDNVIDKQRSSIYRFRDYVMCTHQIINITLQIASNYLKNFHSMEQLETICNNFNLKKFKNNTNKRNSIMHLYDKITNKNIKLIKEHIINEIYNNIINMDAEEIRYKIIRNIDKHYKKQINQNEDLKRSAPLVQIAQEDIYTEYDNKSYKLFSEMIQEFYDTFLSEILSVNKITADENIFDFQKLLNSNNHFSTKNNNEETINDFDSIFDNSSIKDLFNNLHSSKQNIFNEDDKNIHDQDKSIKDMMKTLEESNQNIFKDILKEDNMDQFEDLRENLSNSSNEKDNQLKDSSSNSEEEKNEKIKESERKDFFLSFFDQIAKKNKNNNSEIKKTPKPKRNKTINNNNEQTQININNKQNDTKTAKSKRKINTKVNKENDKRKINKDQVIKEISKDKNNKLNKKDNSRVKKWNNISDTSNNNKLKSPKQKKSNESNIDNQKYQTTSKKSSNNKNLKSPKQKKTNNTSNTITNKALKK